MKLRKILKKTKDGTYFLELTADLVTYIDTHIGPDVIVETDEVWIYNKDKQTCTLAKLAKADVRRLKAAIKQVTPINAAYNREV